MISDIGDRLERLRLEPGPAFHADAEGLSTRFAQLRRLARQARQDPARQTVATAAGTGETESVTPADVTNPGVTDSGVTRFLGKQNRRPTPYEPVPGMDSGGGPPPPRLPWLQPFPDDQLPETPTPRHEPDEQAMASETLELVFPPVGGAGPSCPPPTRMSRPVADAQARRPFDAAGASAAGKRR
ncbi:hypothetical protein CLM62_07795 [Streptomyces sp. SA15]|nr:hypothetical protein CLM62_07795 [Streptomyces sp. SA15]